MILSDEVKSLERERDRLKQDNIIFSKWLQKVICCDDDSWPGWSTAMKTVEERLNLHQPTGEVMVPKSELDECEERFKNYVKKHPAAKQFGPGAHLGGD